MINTSAAYKEMAYSRDYARHFVPRVLLKIVDVVASGVDYSGTSPAFMTNFEQLSDGIFIATHFFGTLEDNSFNLGGGTHIFPDDPALFGQQGFVYETLSDEDGKFGSGVEVLTANYATQISTAGRTIYFNNTYDSVLMDFDVVYYRAGVEIARTQIRNNSSYACLAIQGVKRYDRVTIVAYSTTLPYRRIRILEDIPGIHLFYDELGVISIVLTQNVDVLCNELYTGEIDIEVKNDNNALDIFADFIKRKQPIDVSIDMIFPDGSREAVQIGSFVLYSSRSNIGALSFSFVARDVLDKLSQAEYIKGALPVTTFTLYELAEEVLQDAGITDYTLDPELLYQTTTACLPIALHKELLRLIAQAGQCVVLPTNTGGIHVKYFSPLLEASNMLSNPCFNSDFTDWTVVGAQLSSGQVFAGKQSAIINGPSSIAQNITLEAGNKYFICCYINPSEPITSGTAGIYLGTTLISANIGEANLVAESWSLFATIYVASASWVTQLGVKNIDTISFACDALMCINLSDLYGYGNEPDQEWCENNFHFFIESALVPRAVGPVPQDAFDLYVLEDFPEIRTLDAVKAVETAIYTYKPDTVTSEIYNATRDINGTEQFDIKFSYAASNCTVQVISVDAAGVPTAVNTATLVSSDIYAQAATLKVTANSKVQITVTGYRVNTEETVYRLDGSQDSRLIPDALIKQINNKLVTQRRMAEDISAYAVYWYNKSLEYSFNWRQNPAAENLDSVVVYDALERNNTVLLTERDLRYIDGVIEGSSKGIY